jgi:hypothetical protein
MVLMKDLDDWLKLIAIVVLVLIVGIVLNGCQLWQKDRQSFSDCTLICDDCRGLAMDCELNTNRQNRFTQGPQPTPESIEATKGKEKTDGER